MARSTVNQISGEDPADDPEIEKTYTLLKKKTQVWLFTPVTWTRILQRSKPKKVCSQVTMKKFQF